MEDAHQDTIAHHPTMDDTTIVEASIRHNVFSNNVQWRPQHNLPYTAVPIHSFGSYLCNHDLTIKRNSHKELAQQQYLGQEHREMFISPQQT
jgi:hypothetical protein